LIELNATTFAKMFKNSDRYYSPIEMVQYTQQGLNAVQGDNLQPSIHVGPFTIQFIK